MADQYITLAIYAGLGATVFLAGLLWKKFHGKSSRHDHHDHGQTGSPARPESHYHTAAF